jgi:hypothetical protein
MNAEPHLLAIGGLHETIPDAVVRGDVGRLCAAMRKTKGYKCEELVGSGLCRVWGAIQRFFNAQKAAPFAVLYYTGHGTTTGDWTFQSTDTDFESTLTCENVASLYRQSRCKAKILVIADCCGSGKWGRKMKRLTRGQVNVLSASRCSVSTPPNVIVSLTV